MPERRGAIAGQLQFFGKHASLTNARAFAAYLAPLRNSEWVVYSKRPFGGPEEVLRYLARYTHRVAISNRRLVSLDDKGVTFKWKDYRIEAPERYKVMTLDTHEFIRRFLMHVLPQGFHRIRYYGLLTSQTRAKNIARARELLAVPLIPVDAIKAVVHSPFLAAQRLAMLQACAEVPHPPTPEELTGRLLDLADGGFDTRASRHGRGFGLNSPKFPLHARKGRRRGFANSHPMLLGR